MAPKAREKGRRYTRSGSEKKHRNNPHAPPEEGFSNLKIAGDSTSPSSERLNSIENNSSEWSEYEWSEAYSCYYSYRQTSNGEYEYNYYQPPDSESVIAGENPGYTTQDPLYSPSTGDTYHNYASNVATTSHPITYSPHELNTKSHTEPVSISSNYLESPDQTPSFPIPLPLIPPCNCVGKDKKLCGVLIFPPKDPKPSDGKIERSSSSRQKDFWKSPYGDSLPLKSTNQSKSVKVLGPDGKGCGPLYLPGVTPKPMPRPPEPGTTTKMNEYEYNISEWNKEYEQWKDITCPCGQGYFDRDGVWISGADVRDGKYEPNPDWSKTNGFAPKAKNRKYTGKLHERWEPSSTVQPTMISPYSTSGSYGDVGSYAENNSFRNHASYLGGTSYQNEGLYQGETEYSSAVGYSEGTPVHSNWSSHIPSSKSTVETLISESHVSGTDGGEPS